MKGKSSERARGHVDSREYQSRLRVERFRRGERDVRELVSFLDTLDPEVRLVEGERRRVVFERKLFDTEARDFATAGLKLRTRTYGDRTSCTFKAVHTDRYVAAGAHVESIDVDARTKFEEGLYAFHSSFSKQTTTQQPLGATFARVADWARLFPGAIRYARLGARLAIAAPRTIVTRVCDLELDFVGKRVDASIEIGRIETQDGEIAKVELSWKDRHPRERYSGDLSKRMRHFMQAINASEWVDLDAHLEKARADARSEISATPSTRTAHSIEPATSRPRAASRPTRAPRRPP
jgi:hypothetical protein